MSGEMLASLGWRTVWTKSGELLLKGKYRGFWRPIPGFVSIRVDPSGGYRFTYYVRRRVPPLEPYLGGRHPRRGFVLQLPLRPTTWQEGYLWIEQQLWSATVGLAPDPRSQAGLSLPARSAEEGQNGSGLEGVEAEGEASKGGDSLLYSIPGFFVLDVARYLNHEIDHKERAVLIGAVQMGHTIIPVRYYEVRAERGYSYVRVDPQSSIEAKLNMEENGLYFGGLWHSQMRGTYNPSGVDLETQRLEEEHYNAIGAVFTPEGRITFYSVDKPFRVEIKHPHIRRVEEHVFQIESAAFSGKADS